MSKNHLPKRMARLRKIALLYLEGIKKRGLNV
jgi:hypothetical protein